MSVIVKLFSMKNLLDQLVFIAILSLKCVSFLLHRIIISLLRDEAGCVVDRFGEGSVHCWFLKFCLFFETSEDLFQMIDL